MITETATHITETKEVSTPTGVLNDTLEGQTKASEKRKGFFSTSWGKIAGLAGAGVIIESAGAGIRAAGHSHDALHAAGVAITDAGAGALGLAFWSAVIYGIYKLATKNKNNK